MIVTDAQRCVELESEVAMLNETNHRILEETEQMLVANDRMFKAKCIKCRGSRL